MKTSSLIDKQTKNIIKQNCVSSFSPLEALPFPLLALLGDKYESGPLLFSPLSAIVVMHLCHRRRGRRRQQPHGHSHRARRCQRLPSLFRRSSFDLRAHGGTPVIDLALGALRIKVFVQHLPEMYILM
jgi:hypothetical protein